MSILIFFLFWLGFVVRKRLHRGAVASSQQINQLVLVCYMPCSAAWHLPICSIYFGLALVSLFMHISLLLRIYNFTVQYRRMVASHDSASLCCFAFKKDVSPYMSITVCFSAFFQGSCLFQKRRYWSLEIEIAHWNIWRWPIVSGSIRPWDFTAA